MAPSRVKPQETDPCAIHVGHASVWRIFLDQTQATGGCNRVEQDRTEGPGASKPEWTICGLRGERLASQCGPKADCPVNDLCNIPSLMMELRIQMKQINCLMF